MYVPSAMNTDLNGFKKKLRKENFKFNVLI